MIRTWVRASIVAVVIAAGLAAGDAPGRRAHVTVRGIYGGVPTTLMEGGKTLAGSGVNAVWIGSRGITAARVKALKAQGANVFAEFNTLHRADYLKKHPDAAPVGRDEKTAPAPHGWQGICPTHAAYRTWRMEAFRTLLRNHAIDGVWLDYHHAHASWERAEPALPDTCFCIRCRAQFRKDTGKSDTTGPAWTEWRCALFTDWVREFKEIRDTTRPKALLGTFHCPWTDAEREGALKKKLAIDLRAQAKYLDVFSPMPYHARFGHAQDPAWISRQTNWLGQHLGLKGASGERIKIWPIVQLSDWGESVSVEQVATVLDHGTRLPATGVMVFAWGRLRKQPKKVDAMTAFYRAIRAEKEKAK